MADRREEHDRKAYFWGTQRLVAPATTLARVQPFMKTMGITRIANVTGLDRIGIPVVMAIRPNSRSVAVSQGKGLTLEAARVSGLMEAAETYHAERITLPLKYGSYAELRDDHAIPTLADLPCAAHSRFHDDLPMLWIEGRDLMSSTSLWLPYELVHTNYTLPFPPGSGCFIASTNGLASGNHAGEAISHGVCEVVERDAITLWRLLDEKARALTRIDLATVDDPACREVLDKFHCAGVDVAAWDATSDVGVAAFICLALDRRAESLQPAYGTGCHPTRAIALLRALTEAAQVRATYIAGSRDDIAPAEYRRSAKEGRRNYAAHLFEAEPIKDFTEVPSWRAESFSEDVAWLLQRLRTVGIEQVVMVDLGKSTVIPISVVRIVIPGLESPDEHPEYAPGARALALIRSKR